MTQYEQQIDFSDVQDLSETSVRASIRQFTWSVTSIPPSSNPQSSTPFQTLPASTSIPIDSALTSYRAQSIVLPSTEATENPILPLTRSLRGIKLLPAEDTTLVQICLKNELTYGLDVKEF